MESNGNKKIRGAGEEFPAGFRGGGAQRAAAGVEGGLSPHSEARTRLFHCIKFLTELKGGFYCVKQRKNNG